jgi:alanine racemase
MTDASSPVAARLTIDLAALVRNWRELAARVQTETSAVLKADAYGIGLEPAGRALAAAGCRTFFVAVPDEGLRLRKAAPGAVIYILAGIIPGSADTLIAADLRPVLNSLADVDEWAAARPTGGTAAALHVDTGMNRLGLSLAEARTLAVDKSKVDRLGLALVMSHLVISEVPGHPLNRQQLDAFRAVRALFPNVPASLANSAGIYLGPGFHFDLVRPGIALYGATPGPEVPAPMHVVVTAEARVLAIRDAAAGETVGYGATVQLRRPTRIAVLAVGYADGYHRITSSSDPRKAAHVRIRGETAPLLGRVSMDLIAVDVTDIKDAARGDWAELFGPNVPVDEAAAHARTVGYEFLTGLGHRYERRYIGG